MVLDRLARVLLILLVISLPFEFRAPAPHLTNLQILFLLVMLASAPAMIRHRGELLSNRVVIAAVAFITVVWIAAVVSGPTAVTIKASARYTAGVGLMCAFLSSGKTRSLRQGWTIAAIAAALYGLLDYIGYGYPALFRSMEFYVGDVRRLSGSFEYANSAAAYYALSLPIVWTTIPTIRSRIAWSALVWTALLLTLSRGAAIAAAGCIILWAVRTRSIRPLGLVAVGGFVFAGLSIYQPGLLIRFSNAPKPAANHNAEYRPQYNQIRERPGKTAEMQIVIRNSGGESWPSAGERRVTVSYHWYDTTAKKIVEIPALETPLPHDVKSNDTVAVTARFRTPDTEGFYLLDWDLRYPVYNWFSVADAVPPSVVEAEIASNVESWRGNGDVSSWYGAKKPPAPAAPEIRRTQLWRAALRLYKDHPIFGIGPDNYRLRYGKVLGIADPDTNIHSNNLYLEILVGSGIVGLAAFFILLARISWRDTVLRLPLGVALLHGVFDFFLMTTPLYFAFWILVGEGSQAAKESD